MTQSSYPRAPGRTDAIVESINCLSAFCGMRDVPALTPDALQQRYGFSRADVMVLFGGSIVCGTQVLADAMRQGVAKRYVIVGGAGHTTDALRAQLRPHLPGVDTAALTEAALFAAHLQRAHGLQVDFLECESTNCGNNITYLLALLREKGVAFTSIVLAQDAAMQRRMDATLRKYAPAGLTIINYAVYAATVARQGERLVFSQPPEGMWDIERYVTLLMGEIPRLTNDAEGYGPNGKNFLAPVEIPPQVMRAFACLQTEFAGCVRAANPLYATQA